MVALDQRPLFSRGAVATAVLAASITSFVIALGLLFTPVEYGAEVLINVNPSHISDEWDLLKDQTRGIDFEQQVRSRSVLAPVVTALGLTDESAPGLLVKLGLGRLFSPTATNPEQAVENAVKGIQRRLTVERIRNSSLLRIHIRMPSAETAAQAANKIALSFIELQRRQYLERAQERLDAIEREITQVQDDLSKAIEKRNAFLEDHGWNDYDAELKAATQRVVSIKQQVSNMESSVRKGLYTSGSEIPDDTLKLLVEKMQELDTRLMQVRSRFKEDSPPVMQIAREKADMEKSITAYAARRKSAFEIELAGAQSVMQGLLDAGPAMESYRGSIEHAQRRIQSLFDQRSAIRLETAAAEEKSNGFGDLHVLDTAIAPQEASLNQRFVKILGGVVSAFIVSFFLALICLEVWKYSIAFLVHSPSSPKDLPDKPL